MVLLDFTVSGSNLLASSIPDKKGRSEKDLLNKYPSVYPDDLHTSDICHILTEKDHRAFIKKEIPFLSEDTDGTKRAVELYFHLCTNAIKAFPGIYAVVYKYRSVARQRILIFSRLFAHTLERLYGSHPADHSAEYPLWNFLGIILKILLQRIFYHFYKKCVKIRLFLIL